MTRETVKISITGVLVAFCLSSTVPAFAQSPTQVKSDSLKYLQDLRTQNVRRLQEIDQSLSRKIEEATPAQIDAEVSTLKIAKKEHVLRQEFLDRLIFQIDTKFIGGDLKQFLQASLINMAKIDASNSVGENGIWKFMRYASDALRSLPEQKENILSFLTGYMNRSVSNPVKPEDYISSRNYTNGATSEAGSPVSREDVGSIADRRLQEINLQKPAAAPTSTNE